jgi:hypothetical protein
MPIPTTDALELQYGEIVWQISADPALPLTVIENDGGGMVLVEWTTPDGPSRTFVGADSLTLVNPNG